jgi:pre-mRNA-splicing factor ISY1
LQEDKKRTRYDLYKMADAEYYGYRDDDDGKLALLEAKQEKKARAAVEEEWLTAKRAEKKSRFAALNMEVKDDEPEPVINRGGGEEDLYKAHVALPTREDIEKLVLENKKKELMAKYGH